MFIKIQADNGLAIYDQVVRQVTFAVADHSLRSGDRVPSVRELSKQLAVNPNTIARAYRQLQDDAVLEAVRGVGLQVTAGAERRCREARLSLIRQRLKNALTEARHSGLSVAEIQRLVQQELKS